MFAFTWTKKNGVQRGIEVTSTRKGDCIALGEKGRRRRLTVIPFDKVDGPDVEAGQIYEAEPKNGHQVSLVWPEEMTHDRVLVRVYTNSGYVRNCQGSWRTVRGSPELITEGKGAFGMAGNAGSWLDGLFVLKGGDVLEVRPTIRSNGETIALWVDERGNPQAAPMREWEAAEAISRAKAHPPELVFDGLIAFTWCGTFTPGIAVTDRDGQPGITLGESGRGRKLTHCPTIGVEPGTITRAAVGKLSEKVVKGRLGGPDKTEVLYGVADAHSSGNTGFLVRVNTKKVYTRATRGDIKLWAGVPVRIADGYGAHGIAGNAGGWEDELWVLREGDVLFVRQEGGFKGVGARALFVKGGELCDENWHEWKLTDAERRPEFYVARGEAPLGHVPDEWCHEVVPVFRSGREIARGELIRIDGSTVVINAGWDGLEYSERVLEAHFVGKPTGQLVKRLEGDELVERNRVKAQVRDLQRQATALQDQPWFEEVHQTHRDEVNRIARLSNLLFGDETLETITLERMVDWVRSATERVRIVNECADDARRAFAERQRASLIRKQELGSSPTTAHRTSTPAPRRSYATSATAFAPKTLTHKSGRTFLCSCGGSVRLTKSEHRDWKAGAEVTAHCVKCGCQGVAKK